MTQEKEPQLKTRDKIFLGGLGALTPVIMNLLAVDLEKLLINITLISVIAYMIKVLILFYIGGMVAYLNKDENKPIKLFQLGIYAPAMIIAFMNSNPLQTGDEPMVVPKSPIPIEQPAKDTQNEKDENAFLWNGLKYGSAFLSSSSSIALLQDSVKSKTKKLVENLQKPSEAAFVTPLLERLVERDPKFLDSLEQELAAHRHELSKVRLVDSTFYSFRYPDETPTEQFLRGFLGWKSDRLWYVIVGKFKEKKNAILYAKSITKELHNQPQLVAQWHGKPFLPVLVKPYGNIVPEYSVVMAQNVTYNDAKVIMQMIKNKGLSTINEEAVELWKLPYY